MMRKNQDFRLNCYKFSFESSLRAFAQEKETPNKVKSIIKALKKVKVVNIAKKSKYIELKENDYACFPYGGFLFHGRLEYVFEASLFKNRKSLLPLAKVLYQDIALIYPTDQPMRCSSDDTTVVLAFSPQNGMAPSLNNPYFAYWLKKSDNYHNSMNSGGGKHHEGISLNSNLLKSHDEYSDTTLGEDDHHYQGGFHRERRNDYQHYEKNIILQHVTDKKVLILIIISYNLDAK